MKNHPPILLIQTGRVPQPLRTQLGDLSDWFAEALPIMPSDMQIVRVCDGEPLPAPDPHTIAIITGSWSMVTEHLSWSETTAKWIQQAFHLGTPMFGICYGHQLMAYALGGTVDFNPRGREMGCYPVELHDAGRQDPLLADCPAQFMAPLSHLQTVITPPTDAITLATSSRDANQIIRYGNHALSVQFHPEFTPAILSGLLEQRKALLLKEGHSIKELQASVTTTPIARQLLLTFIDHYITR